MIKTTLATLLILGYIFGLIERSQAWYTQQRNGSLLQWLLAFWLGLSTVVVSFY